MSQEKLKYLQNKKFCLIFAKEEDNGKVTLRPIYGRADISREGNLSVRGDHGTFAVPASAYSKVLPSDGTELLKDAEFFVICTVSGMDL
ncbi:MAG: hypothetical protein HRT89_14810 [Lentisphaeria bacterium]|nr:hypothetical protein [Lentisphaeria bacterium]NQZ69330.1 hypothetical protein [Lentisphaeria bacterium]